MAGRGRFQRARMVPMDTHTLVWRVAVAWRVDSRHPAGSLCSTDMTNDDMLRRGAATDLMGEVGDAFIGPRVVPVAGESTI